ncbi:hypothetical protein BDY19DRAFT_907139 [Irpex rosettiformis]|uniref:Uncharacterized protein n=1 Tax=Irpex rosettiformis TaxID=378272 RepID=A0ACB8U110_9APHY|nr:hypothetical protein BDY19DRAFT_907139 [Irpex rosettiformis]
MSSELLKLYRTGDYDAIARIKMEEQRTIKTTADKIASTNQAFKRVTLENGEKIHMARTDEPTTYCQVLPGSIIKLGNGKAECVALVPFITLILTTTGPLTMLFTAGTSIRSKDLVQALSLDAIPPYVIPGMSIASDVGSAAVYFKTFIFENDYPVAGKPQ